MDTLTACNWLLLLHHHLVLPHPRFLDRRAGYIKYWHDEWKCIGMKSLGKYFTHPKDTKFPHQSGGGMNTSLFHDWPIVRSMTRDGKYPKCDIVALILALRQSTFPKVGLIIDGCPSNCHIVQAQWRRVIYALNGLPYGSYQFWGDGRTSSSSSSSIRGSSRLIL